MVRDLLALGDGEREAVEGLDERSKLPVGGGRQLAGDGGAYWYPIASKRLLDTRTGQALAGRFAYTAAKGGA